MKKLVFLFVAFAAVSFASCGNKAANSEANVDSTATVVEEATPVVADSAAVELTALAKKEKVSLDSSAVLAQLYTFVDEYRSEFATPAGFTRFLSLLPGINPLTTPGLYKLCTTAANKY